MSSENYHFLDLGMETKTEVFNKLRVLAQKWIGDFVEISGTSVYGLRKYTRGAFLLGHLDHLKYENISMIYFIFKQELDSIKSQSRLFLEIFKKDFGFAFRFA